MLCAFSCHLLAGDFMSCNSWDKSRETKRKKGGKKKKNQQAHRLEWSYQLLVYTDYLAD